MSNIERWRYFLNKTRVNFAHGNLWWGMEGWGNYKSFYPENYLSEDLHPIKKELRQYYYFYNINKYKYLYNLQQFIWLSYIFFSCILSFLNLLYKNNRKGKEKIKNKKENIAEIEKDIKSSKIIKKGQDFNESCFKENNSVILAIILTISGAILFQTLFEARSRYFIMHVPIMISALILGFRELIIFLDDLYNILVKKNNINKKTCLF